jgi:hypothetical protein
MFAFNDPNSASRSIGAMGLCLILLQIYIYKHVDAFDLCVVCLWYLYDHVPLAAKAATCFTAEPKYILFF